MWKVLTLFKFNPAGLPRDRKVLTYLGSGRGIDGRCWRRPFRCMSRIWDYCSGRTGKMEGMRLIHLFLPVGPLLSLRTHKFLLKTSE